ncbi:hypothetical protein HHO41_14035 [Bacillus sp. DNRA2]|uniref:hypothetical protein n=1 Tax=Bacillus sp. DNRA2 TaxID=2723053 RepID=UPI00145E88D0|nr:hypothetical protein [Bacillus sp. DNRA2]NMD71421.1 hypothetical protein [Bacillus sp. DNRA2]
MKDQLNNPNDQNADANVEFGIEFGDINGAKLIEYPFMNQNQPKKKEKKKQKK